MMQGFTTQLSSVAFTEVLGGFSSIAFDVVSAESVKVVFTESAATPDPSTGGVMVRSWPNGWDFIASDFVAGYQRIWAMGNTEITGVRQ